LQELPFHNIAFGFYSDGMRTNKVVKIVSDLRWNLCKSPLGLLCGKWISRLGGGE
jgi:hypothetical protein